VPRSRALPVYDGAPRGAAPGRGAARRRAGRHRRPEAAPGAVGSRVLKGVPGGRDRGSELSLTQGGHQRASAYAALRPSSRLSTWRRLRKRTLVLQKSISIAGGKLSGRRDRNLRSVEINNPMPKAKSATRAYANPWFFTKYRVRDANQ